MNILWIKDGKKGHEKQVQALLDELSKTINIKIYEETYHISSLKRFFDILNHATSYVLKKYDSYIIRSYYQNDIHLVVGAGSNIHTRILLLKKALKNIYNRDIIAISVLTPSLFKNEFNFICAPNHDEIKLSNNINKTIFFEGSLAKVSIEEPDDNIGLIGLGGVNKHFIFNEDDLIKQIEYVLTLYPKKDWYLFSSRRTSDLMIDKIKTLTNSFSNLIVTHENFDEIIKHASIKFITQDSMNMVYESLSTKGQTFVFNMKYKNENKITKQIKKLIENKQIGYIENITMSDGLKKIKIQPQNPHYEVFAEVEKLSFQLAGKLKALK